MMVKLMLETIWRSPSLHKEPQRGDEILTSISVQSKAAPLRLLGWRISSTSAFKLEFVFPQSWPALFTPISAGNFSKPVDILCFPPALEQHPLLPPLPGRALRGGWRPRTGSRTPGTGPRAPHRCHAWSCRFPMRPFRDFPVRGGTTCICFCCH